MTRAFVRSSSCVGPVLVLGGFVVSVRSSADVVATLRRVVRFSGYVVVVPHASVRSSSCVGPVPVLGGFVVSVPVRSSILSSKAMFVNAILLAISTYRTKTRRVPVQRAVKRNGLRVPQPSSSAATRPAV